MLSDPLSITISGTTYALAKVDVQGSTTVYRDPTSACKLTVAHAYNKRTRSLFRLDFQKIASDPLTATNQSYVISAQVVVDKPQTGFVIADQKAVMDGLTTFMNAASGANLTKFLGGES